MDYICHHGIKGQKWGVRRYQNKDGSLTEAGKDRLNKIKDKYTQQGNERVQTQLNYIRDLEQQQILQIKQTYGVDPSVEKLRDMPREAAAEIIKIHNATTNYESFIDNVKENYTKQVDSLKYDEYMNRGKTFLKSAGIGGTIGAVTMGGLMALAGGLGTPAVPIFALIGGTEGGLLSGGLSWSKYIKDHPNSDADFNKAYWEEYEKWH